MNQYWVRPACSDSSHWIGPRSAASKRITSADNAERWTIIGDRTRRATDVKRVRISGSNLGPTSGHDDPLVLLTVPVFAKRGGQAYTVIDLLLTATRPFSIDHKSYGRL